MSEIWETTSLLLSDRTSHLHFLQLGHHTGQVLHRLYYRFQLCQSHLSLTERENCVSACNWTVHVDDTFVFHPTWSLSHWGVQYWSAGSVRCLSEQCWASEGVRCRETFSLSLLPSATPGLQFLQCNNTFYLYNIFKKINIFLLLADV